MPISKEAAEAMRRSLNHYESCRAYAAGEGPRSKAAMNLCQAEIVAKGLLWLHRKELVALLPPDEGT